jgi:hypothetical protein
VNKSVLGKGALKVGILAERNLPLVELGTLIMEQFCSEV